MNTDAHEHARLPALAGFTATLALSLSLTPLALPAQDAGGLSALTRIQPGVSHAVTSSDPDFNSNLDRITAIQPGDSAVLADIAGPGVITHIWLTFAEAQPELAGGERRRRSRRDRAAHLLGRQPAARRGSAARRLLCRRFRTPPGGALGADPGAGR